MNDTNTEQQYNKWKWCMAYCKLNGLAPSQADAWEYANKKYEECNPRGATMKEQKEIKFQDKTRGGLKYVIHTYDGMCENFPIVGEALEDGAWDVQCWTKDGKYYEDGSRSDYDLIPIEPAELEGLKVGDKVWSYHANECAISWDVQDVIPEERGGGFIVGFTSSADDKYRIPVKEDGRVMAFNNQQMFYRTKERALASIRENNNVA